MVPLGKKAPDFSLSGIEGKRYALRDFEGKKALVIMFICKHCPYVVAVQERLAKLADEFQPKGVQFVAICSNDSDHYPEDGPDGLRAQAAQVGFKFPYLIDDSQTVARAYGAVCTPDIFVFDSQFKLSYRGRIDDSWKDEAKVTRREMAAALTALLNGKAVDEKQMPSMGCSIKWK